MRTINGLKDLVFDAIEETTKLVERTHLTEAERYTRLIGRVVPGGAVQAVGTAHRLGARGVYAAIHTVQRGVRRVADAGCTFATQAVGENAVGSRIPGTPLRSDVAGTLPWWFNLAHGALNGVMGDRLNERGNDLAIPLGLRHEGRPLPVDTASLIQALPQRTGKVCILVHGLACTEWLWSIDAKAFHGDPRWNFGTLLARDLGYTPLYLRYNTGLRVSQNGRRLSDLLTALVAAYPEPITELVLIGHSMGGLVVRSAAHYGVLDGQPWIEPLKHVFCIGAPHHGAPLEQVGNVLTSVLNYFDTPGTRIPALILNARSAGVKDLRFGNVVDEDWESSDPDELYRDNRTTVVFVEGVAYTFIAATLTHDPEHPLARLAGDLLVCVPSAAGRSPHPVRTLPFQSGHVLGGTNHFHLANHPDVYEQIKQRCVEG